MRFGARILVVEDDEGWIDTLTDVLQPEAELFAVAKTVKDACALVQRNYFNIAIVDISLRIADPKDNEGMRFLECMREEGMAESMAFVIFSAYGREHLETVVAFFRDFKVADFLDKTFFEADKLLVAIQNALTANHLNRAVTITISHNRQLSDLWSKLRWAQRDEDPAQLEPELRDLLMRLFPGATALFIQDMATGQSGAGLLHMTPTYDQQTGEAQVVKFGRRRKIIQERDRFYEHVTKFTSHQSAIQSRAAVGRALGAISYSMVGTSLKDVIHFGRYYEQHDLDRICAVVDNLVQVALSRWYGNIETPRVHRDLVAIYQQRLNTDWEVVWMAATETGIDLAGSQLEFGGIGREYPNPKVWLEQRHYEINREIWRTVIHGDLNEKNILVDKKGGHSWLIDFYRTGWCHILGDLVELETAIKFSILEVDKLREQAYLESYLNTQQNLDTLALPAKTDPFYKPLAVIGHIRKHADRLAGVHNGMVEYNIGLLLTTLHLLTVDFLQPQRPRILLSAAMLCERLGDVGLEAG